MAFPTGEGRDGANLLMALKRYETYYPMLHFIVVNIDDTSRC
jgi:hypothetical protein